MPGVMLTFAAEVSISRCTFRWGLGHADRGMQTALRDADRLTDSRLTDFNPIAIREAAEGRVCVRGALRRRAEDRRRMLFLDCPHPRAAYRL